MNFSLIPLGLMQKQAVHAVVICNDYTARFGLALTQAEAVELVETRNQALSDNDRIEFGGGVIDKLIKAFCDSPYLSRYNYTQTLNELIELFYYYKNDAMDLITDDALIRFMKSSFDGVCQGSLELLAERELHQMARNLRFGLPINTGEQKAVEEDEEDEWS